MKGKMWSGRRGTCRSKVRSEEFDIRQPSLAVGAGRERMHVGGLRDLMM